MTNRILIAICQMLIYQHFGKDMDRCRDFSLIEYIADYEKIPEIWDREDH